VAVSPRGSAYSSDNGATWTLFDDANNWTVSFLSADVGWAGGRGRISRVVNGSPSDPALPPFVAAVDRAATTSSSPAADPDAWVLAFVDVETTGLVPGYHEMIDLGMVVTDLDGNVLDTLFVRTMPLHPERLSPGAAAVNGFSVERWERLGAVSPSEAVAELVRFHRRVAGDRNALLVAFNSQFDAAFLDHLFRADGRTWRELYHYFVLDVPSMAWSQGLRELTGNALARRLGIPDEPRVADEHTGVRGAMLNVRIYQALRARGAGLP
jgi:DNA polymerase III epsilon subunit-like protein